jgi:hypothetical protein
VPSEVDPGRPPGINFQTPQSARVWNYWLGGNDNYPVDRAAGDEYIKIYPEIVELARQSREFLVRAVRHVTKEAGIRQFLDIGPGLPTRPNTHEVAQEIAADARVVYVDNDPMVLVYARAWLTSTTPAGVTDFVEADYHDPDLIISEAAGTLRFDQPVALMLMGVLGHVEQFERVRSIVTRLIDAVPSGSYLLLWDSTDTNPAYAKAAQTYAHSGAVPYRLRPIEQLRQLFDGLELVEPGFVPLNRWRPDAPPPDAAASPDAYGAVARKP